MIDKLRKIYEYFIRRYSKKECFRQEVLKAMQGGFCAVICIRRLITIPQKISYDHVVVSTERELNEILSSYNRNLVQTSKYLGISEIKSIIGFNIKPTKYF